MKLFILICIILPATSGVGLTQTPAVLHTELDRAGTDSLKISAYQNLINHYKYSNIDSALYYAKEGLDYAREKQYAPGEAIMINNLGQVNERHGFMELAETQYLQACEIFRTLENKNGVASTTNGLGVIAGRTGRYDEATKYFLEALALFQATGNAQGIVQTYIKLGVVSDHLGNSDQALAYYLRAEELNATDPSSSAFLTLMNNIGIIYGKRNDLRVATTYFKKGLKHSDPEKFTGIHIALLGSLGLAYKNVGMTDSAWHFQQQALSMARQNRLPEEEARALVNLAALVDKSDPSQSFQLLTEALAITERIQELKLKTEVYEAMIAHYKQRHEFGLALELSEKRQLLKDSLFSLAKSREIANLHAIQELARQDDEIKDLALKNERSIFQRNLMIGVALAAIAIIGIVWFYNTKVSHLNGALLAKQNELKRSNNIKDKLFSILGHDLRAPLSQVIGFLNALSLKNLGKDDSSLVEKLRLQSEHTLATLDNLLMWGHNQLKGIRLNQQTLRVKEQVTKSIFLTNDYAAQKNITLVNSIPPDLNIHVDPSHFDFVIRNLLSNAIKFSHSGGTVLLEAVSFADQEVIFSVRDSGVGIHPELRKTIFTANAQSLQGTWKEKGTGIGLMLCREYIIENGGRMWLESEEGKGSTFYFSLKKTLIAASHQFAV